MILITVTESEEGDGIQQLNVDDILFMQFDNRLSIAVHTEGKQYVAVGPLRFWEAAFEKAGLNFMRVDRGVLANVDKITSIDEDFKLAYFDMNINREKKSCTMSSAGYKLFQEKNSSVPEVNNKGLKLFRGLSWPTSP
ncbi:LytTR family transcriptional regulator DNA-binding domain-containing protein [Paenibacillus tritici]|uniref:LytTR family DNA-binding domain-containing protein n=1 Tax=Paenibacillus tritici TaxID=1873425 RepID=UPI001BA56965|nr:LytTR family DNA-binding domain-containing protein [Paenibacillus tritici]QUL57607.1 LytTR family transcriptional regulator DNA-binding domain-containing protein [Paenibacillus tritici]